MTNRHGDVFLTKIDAIPNDAKSLGERKELAFGEKTGHTHRIKFGKLFETEDGVLYLKTDRQDYLAHEEHKEKVIEPGFYRIGIKRQYKPDGWESVRD